jgi:hypothetical protein
MTFLAAGSVSGQLFLQLLLLSSLLFSFREAGGIELSQRNSARKVRSEDE